MQGKTTIISKHFARIGLDIHPTKSKILKVNTENTRPNVLGDRPLEEVNSFTYLGSNVDQQGGTDADIRIRIGKARTAFHQLKNVWRSTVLSTKTKLRIFNSIVKSVLLYGAETWRTTVANTKKYVFAPTVIFNVYMSKFSSKLFELFAIKYVQCFEYLAFK